MLQDPQGLTLYSTLRPGPIFAVIFCFSEYIDLLLPSTQKNKVNHPKRAVYLKRPTATKAECRTSRYYVGNKP
jgi:hypothetical protein